MKRLFIPVLAAALMFTGCAQQIDTVPEGSQPAATQEAAEPTPTPGSEPAPEASLEPSPAPESAPVSPELLDAMFPAMDAIIRTMGTESSIAYSHSDTEFFWHVLHTMATSWGHLHQEAAVEEDRVRIPTAQLCEMAAAAFSGFTALPEIPEDMDISYDEEKDEYIFERSAASGTLTMIEDSRTEGDETVVTMGLYSSPTERLGGVVFRMQAAPGGAGALFPCRVTGAANEIALGLSCWVETPYTELSVSSAGSSISVAAAERENSVVLSFILPEGELTAEIEHITDPVYHIADVVTGDGFTELFVTGELGSSDYITYAYRVVDGNLLSGSMYGGVNSIDSLGNIYVSSMIDLFGMHNAHSVVRLGDDLVFQRISGYTVQLDEDSWEHSAITVAKDGLPLLNTIDGSEFEAEEGDRFLLAGTDLSSYATLIDRDNMRCIVDIAPGEEYGWTIAGEQADEWFEDLEYAG